ncbi:hypothetical protein [Thomasclavelia sp.]|uniref:hypothetical protein n=1 Tax=Thomasclavelia sp. TaxID=3025757 RepID=UPI0025D34929|nr:hypothetical protein [Thomasclavelia sp.]
MDNQIKSRLDIINKIDNLSYMVDSIKEQITVLNGAYSQIDFRVEKYIYAISINLDSIYKELVRLSNDLHCLDNET